jgi:hypothetical protein
MVPNFHHTPRQLAVLILATAATAGCSRGSAPVPSDTTSAQAAPAAAADTSAIVRGAVTSVSATVLVIKTDTGTVTVNVVQPFQVYASEPGRLADVKDNSFIGVTTVKQPDGAEKATEIHIFAEALRGLGEGSHMMTEDTSGGGHRMTNGAVSASRMSNGNVASTNGSTYVVQYPGGSQQVTVPANTPVTEIKATTKTLAAGDQVFVMVKKGADGSLSASKALLAGK